MTGYEDLIPGLQLPDPNDRHVLAAAIRGHADVIVTMNLRDFPARHNSVTLSDKRNTRTNSSLISWTSHLALWWRRHEIIARA